MKVKIIDNASGEQMVVDKKMAISVLAKRTMDFLIAGDFWSNPDYALEIAALRVLGYKVRKY